MEIYINDIKITANVGESVLDLIRRNGMDDPRLSKRPIAARIGGETFNLNYIPMRTDCEQRSAIREGNGSIELIRYDSPRGKRLYERSMLMVFFLACRNVFPQASVKVMFTVGDGLYITVKKQNELTDEDIMLLEQEYRRIVSEDRRFIRKRYSIDDAIDHFSKEGQYDKVELLKWRQFTYFDAYHIEGYEDYIDYFYGEMAPSTGYVSVCRFAKSADGLMLMFPDEENVDIPADHIPYPRLQQALTECDEWGELLECSSVCDLNKMTENGKLRELVRINEALHEKHFADIADSIIERDAKIVLIAGPSSSGKTTSANRICTQLRVHGKQPILISLDDYYIDRDKLTPDENGEYDLEHINTIDSEQFRRDLRDILDGKSVWLPKFSFPLQKRVESDRCVQLTDRTIFVIEGIHGLNPTLIPQDIDQSRIFKIYVSALIALNLDHHNRIATTYLRILRRMVRDHRTRGTSVEKTMAMWQSIRRGEKRWIFPYQEGADVMINTSTVYELAVLKKHIFPLLLDVEKDDPNYDSIRSIVKFLNYVLEADVDAEIPPTSIVREFIGGNTFYE